MLLLSLAMALSLARAPQALGMPEAARRASALLSLAPSHAACRSSDVGATLQQQQRVTSAIRAGTARLQLDEHPAPGVANTFSNSLLQWATMRLSRQTLKVALHCKEGIVCLWRLNGVSKMIGRPVFSCDDSRLGVAFVQAAVSGHIHKVALISLAQPHQQPLVVTLGDVAAGITGQQSMLAAPSADLFLVCQAEVAGSGPPWQVSLSFCGGSSCDLHAASLLHGLMWPTRRSCAVFTRQPVLGA